jgi:hypothetical protein
MKRSRIVAALLAVIVTASIFAVPYFARGVDSLMDMGTFYFYVIDSSEEKK